MNYESIFIFILMSLYVFVMLIDLFGLASRGALSMTTKFTEWKQTQFTAVRSMQFVVYWGIFSEYFWVVLGTKYHIITSLNCRALQRNVIWGSWAPQTWGVWCWNWSFVLEKNSVSSWHQCSYLALFSALSYLFNCIS